MKASKMTAVWGDKQLSHCRCAQFLCSIIACLSGSFSALMKPLQNLNEKHCSNAAHHAFAQTLSCSDKAVVKCAQRTQLSSTLIQSIGIQSKTIFQLALQWAAQSSFVWSEGTIAHQSQKLGSKFGRRSSILAMSCLNQHISSCRIKKSMHSNRGSRKLRILKIRTHIFPFLVAL